MYRVEQGFPPHGDVEGDVQVGLIAAGVELHIPEMYESYILQNHFLGSHIAILLSPPTNTTTPQLNHLKCSLDFSAMDG